MRKLQYSAVLAVVTGSSVLAATVPFVEDFDADSANWVDGALAPAGWVAAGGPDGGAHATTSFNFVNSVDGDTPAVFRAETGSNPSGGAFFGNYVNEGVTAFQFDVRHDAPAPLTFFTRFATPSPGFGAIAINFAPVFPNTWTTITIPIAAGNPQFVTFEAADAFPNPFEQVFALRDINRIQLGVTVPAGLAGVDAAFGFDFDKVTLVPEPAAGVLVLLGGLFLRRRG